MGRRERTTHWRHAAVWAVAVLAMAVIVFASGCASSTTPVGRNETPASYTLGTLKAELPPDVAIPAVAAAAEASLRSRGYTVTDIRTTDDAASVTAKAYQGSAFSKTTVAARATPTGTLVSVQVAPLGDRTASAIILDDVLARLDR